MPGPQGPAVVGPLGAFRSSQGSTVKSINGSATQVLGGLTQAASGSEVFTGSVVQKIGGLRQAATGTETFPGSIVQRVGSLRQVASGTTTFSGNVSQKVGGLRQTAVGGLTFSGTSSQRVGSLRQTAIGGLTFSGSVSQRVGSLRQTSSGSTTFAGIITQSIRRPTQSAQGSTTFSGTASQRVVGLRSLATGSFALTGTAAQRVGSLSQSASGALIFSGSITQSIGHLRGLPVYEGPTSQKLGAVNQTSQGHVLPAKAFPTGLTNFFVDPGNIGCSHLGLVTAPFRTITDAINLANQSNNPAISIFVAPGDYSSETLTFGEGVIWTLEGPVSGAVLVGPIVWKASGGANPVPTSALVLRQIEVQSLRIDDGFVPATSAVLVLENTAIINSIRSTGSSIVKALISGISTSSIAISGNQVSSLIEGDIYLPNCFLGLTNTQILGMITGKKVWAHGCQLQTVTCTGTSVELQLTQLGGSATPSVNFSGAFGTFILGAETSTQWWLLGGLLTNGVITYTTPAVLKTFTTFTIPALTQGQSTLVNSTIVYALPGDTVAISFPTNAYLYGAEQVSSPGVVTFQVFALAAAPLTVVTAAVTVVKN
jgi:hypothetical protein